MPQGVHQARGRWEQLGQEWASGAPLLTLCSWSRTLLASAALKWRAKTLAISCQAGGRRGGASAPFRVALSSSNTFSRGLTTRLSLELGPML